MSKVQSFPSLNPLNNALIISSSKNIGIDNFDVLRFGSDPDGYVSGTPLKFAWSSFDAGNGALELVDDSANYINFNAGFITANGGFFAPSGTISSLFGTTASLGTSVTSPLILGSSSANGDITIRGTSSATKTSSYVILQDTGGNVGIGTVSPTHKLDVVGGDLAIDNSAFYKAKRTNGNYQEAFGMDSNDDMVINRNAVVAGVNADSPKAASGVIFGVGAGKFFTVVNSANNLDMIRADETTGNVVFGSPVAGPTTPENKVHIFQNNSNTGYLGGLTIENNTTGDAGLTLLTTFTRRWEIGIRGSESGNKFYITQDNTGAFGSNGIVIDGVSTGNPLVGINTTSPASHLEIDGVDGTDHFRLKNTTASTGRIWSLNSENTGIFGLVDRTGSARLMSANSSGEFAFGPSSSIASGYTLTFTNGSTGGVKFVGSGLINNYTNNNDADFQILVSVAGAGDKVATIGGSAGSSSLAFKTANVERARIDSNGNFGIHQTTITSFLHLAASTTSYSSLRIPSGTAPTSPNDGDIWNTSTALVMRINSVTDDVVGTTRTQTLTNKRITQRVVSMADATSFTPTGDTADINTQANTQIIGTLTANAPSGTPTDGQSLYLRIKSTNVQTYAWNGIYRAGSTVALPATSTGSSKTDYLYFKYNSTDSKWDLIEYDAGF